MCKKHVRYIQVVMLFMALVIAFTMRVNMSMAIVSMTDKEHDDNVSTATLVRLRTVAAKTVGKKSFDWNIQTQSVILSSYFWGYVILQVPAGELAARFGGMILVTICIIINSIASMFIPVGAYYGGWHAVCFCRFVQGLFQGFLFPAIHNLIGKWVPLEEKGRLGTLIYGGAYLGTAMQMMVSGFIAVFWGWPTIFYINGTIGVIWVILYIVLGSPSPQKSRMITAEERLYIQTSLGQIGEQKRLKTPWRKIATSLPFYALLIVHCGHNWGFWTLMMEMPTYMKKVLGVDIKKSGVMSAFPYLALYCLSFPFGFLTDYVLKKKWTSVNVCRKVSNSIGEYGPALALIALCFVPAGNVNLAVAMLTIVVGLNAGHLSGYLLVHIDMAPNFAGSLMGITNFFANITGILAPIFAGSVLKNEFDPTQWHVVFYVASGIYFVTNTIYVIFGTSKRQTWNDPEETEVTRGWWAQRNILEDDYESQSYHLRGSTLQASIHSPA